MNIVRIVGVSNNFFKKYGLYDIDNELMPNIENEHNRPYVIVIKLNFKGKPYDFAIPFRSNIAGHREKIEYFALPPRKETKPFNIHGLHFIKMFPVDKSYLVKYNYPTENKSAILTKTYIQKNFKRLINEAQKYIELYEKGYRPSFCIDLHKLCDALYKNKQGVNKMTNLKIMSFNIRGDFDSGTEAWDIRKQNLTKIIIAENPDTIGFQEVMPHQYDDLKSLLTGYNSTGIGREDGKSKGEHAAIFFKSSRFTKFKTSSFWLSETPDKPSFGWDAHCIRICTYAKLTDNLTGKEFYHFNTHLDHMGQVAMVEGAKLVRKSALGKKVAAIITGDFNVYEDAEAYKIMTAQGLQDAKYAAKESMSYATFHGYNPPSESLGKESPIDYIFLTSRDFNVQSYKVIVNGEPGNYASDHYPIVAEVSY